MGVAVRLVDVEKYFGDFKALDKVSFEVKEGEIVGFLGPNGAGKTTTMRIVTGFMEQTSGKVEVFGYDNIENPMDIKKITGYLPEQPPLYPELSVREYLDFVALIKGVEPNRAKKRIDEVIELIGLEEKADFLIGHLSKGYKQRVGIAQAIIHSPKLLILDEPTVGLDPIQIIEVREVIKRLAKSEQRTIILSTHILQEVNAICERALIINKGRIVNEVTISLEDRFEYLINLNKPATDVVYSLRDVEGVFDISYEGNSLRVIISSMKDGEIREIVVRKLFEMGFLPVEITKSSTAIERIFVESVYS
jgi:ABC-2 type transport system ATP-binding protein